MSRIIQTMRILKRHRITSILGALALLAGGGALVIERLVSDTPPSPGTRVVRFGTGRPFGRLDVRDWGSTNSLAWQFLHAAYGKVEVPAGKELMLTAYMQDPSAFRRSLRKFGVKRGDDFSPDLSALTLLRPSDIQALDLSQISIKDKDLVHLKGLTHLRGLYLNNRKYIGDDALEYLKPLKSLRLLDLHRTRVTDAGLAVLKGLPCLERVRLSGTQIGDSGLAHLQDLTSLTVLILNNTNVGDAGLESLRALTSLEELRLGGTSITDAGLADLAGLTSLRDLDISGAQITDAGLVHLQDMNELWALDLSKTNVTSAALRLLEGLPSLRMLDVAGTRIALHDFASCGLASLETLYANPETIGAAEAEALQQALPDCQILQVPHGGQVGEPW